MMGKRHRPLLSKARGRSEPRLKIRRHKQRRNRRKIYEFYLDLGDVMGEEYGGQVVLVFFDRILMGMMDRDHAMKTASGNSIHWARAQGLQ